MKKKTVLITGCQTGFGRLTAKTFSEKGWNVIATMLWPEKETELTKMEDVLVNRLDVTDHDTIKQAVAEGLERFGTIDVLVNNAGYGGHGLFEQFSDKSVRAMFEVNIFGHMNVARAVLPIMRKQKGGCIINVSSMAGLMGIPTNSVYSATKFAVEGFTEALALEYKPLNIIAKTVAPGAFMTTSFVANNDNHLEEGDEELVAHAKKQREHFNSIVVDEGGEKSDPQEVADKIYQCATSETPVHNHVGSDAEMLVGMTGNPPRQDFLDKIAAWLLPPH